MSIQPMLATLIDKPFNSDEWLFETKWDGYRALAFVQDQQVKLLSRNNLSLNERFAPVVAELKKLKKDVVLDGEIVILDAKGRSQFQLMQNYQRTQQGDLFYYVFDILFEDGEDLREKPLLERKKRLEKLFKNRPFHVIRLSAFVQKEGIAAFEMAQKHQLEGIIGKKIDSFYSGRRSRNWVKIKTHLRQEAVIGGFTAPRGTRPYFGALLLGVYDNKKLTYIGHTGGGFTVQLLEEVYNKLSPLAQSKCPFTDSPKPNAPVTWVKPLLVCEITFAEWTTEGIARQPIFLGLRLDKKATSVKREIPS